MSLLKPDHTWESMPSLTKLDDDKTELDWFFSQYQHPGIDGKLSEQQSFLSKFSETNLIME